MSAFFEDYKRRESEVLNDAMVFQENRIEDVLSELSEQLQKLNSYNLNLSSLDQYDEGVMIVMSDIIDDIHNEIMKFSPDINLEGLKIDVDIDEDIITRLEKLLIRSTEMCHGFLPAMDGSDRDTETYRDLIKNMWNCVTCGAQFGVKQVECLLCK